MGVQNHCRGTNDLNRNIRSFEAVFVSALCPGSLSPDVRFQISGAGSSVLSPGLKVSTSPLFFKQALMIGDSRIMRPKDF